MNKFNKDLVKYQHQVIRKQRLEDILENLRKQSATLDDKLKSLGDILAKEEKDVRKIEGVSLSALFFSLLGKRDERIDKEKREAYAAKAKYDMAKQEYDEVIREIELRLDELTQLKGCEEKYKAALQKKVDYVKANNMPYAGKVIDLENKITYMKGQKKEMSEAIMAGKKVLSAASRAADCLDSAKSFSTWDIVGGGIVADVMKHSKLDDAQEHIYSMQSALRRFKTELNDVNMDANMTVNVSGFGKFADYFFDGLFVDLAVRSHITSSIEEVNNISKSVNDIVNKLQYNCSIIDEEIQNIRKEYEELVMCNY